MRAPITDKHLLEMMWERFPEIMKRGAEQPTPEDSSVVQPAPVQPAEWADAHGNYQWRGVISNAAMPTPVQQEPVAVVSGYYGGQCVILPIDPARIFNSNTTLYTKDQL